jgi:hypothetical protein
MRILAIVLTTLCLWWTAASADPVVLSASRIAPTSVALSWSGGTTLYQVYRSSAPLGVIDPANLIDQTSASASTDAAASGPILFYQVTGGHCADAASCPPAANECATATCTAGDCGFQNVAAGTHTSSQTAGDCQVQVCDGSGNVTSNEDSTDVPADSNPCTLGACQGGVPTFPNLPTGTSCRVGSGSRCESGVCVPSVAIVRVGDGISALSGNGAAVTVDEFLDDGTLISSVPIYTTITGSNQPCTLGGTSTTEGNLTRSSNESVLQFAGYSSAPGSATPSSSSSGTFPRIVCSVTANGVVDTTTRMGSAFNGGAVRGAASVDGSHFWVSGASSGTSGGVWYVSKGSSGGTQILTSPNNARAVEIFSGQLYGDSGSSGFANVFTVGTGLPTMSGQVATPLAGLPLSVASPGGFAFFDLSPGVAGLDTLYIADGRSIPMGGGVQKWTFDGTTWSLEATFTQGISAGALGLTGYVQPSGKVELFVTTSETSSNKLVSFIDDGVNTNPAATVISTAATNTVYRGVAMGAH